MTTFRLALLNVSMPKPHGVDRYLELFKLTYRLKRVVGLRGEYRGMLGTMSMDEGAVQITGQFYKFFDLDPEASWFDIALRQEAQDDDLAQIRIPENLKPHHQIFDFVFFPKSHQLAYVARDAQGSMSPQMAKKLLDELFSDEQLIARFGPIAVTAIPRSDQLTKILQIPRLKRLRIEVVPPNPDDLEEAQKDVMERMASEHAQQMTIELSTKHPDGLSPDADHRKLAKIAQTNGRVIGVGQNAEGQTVEMKTTDHPLVEPMTYDPDVELRSAALARKARDLLNRS